jgi:predicted permease
MSGQLIYDSKHAIRGLLRDRGFTAVALLSIGLGVGANSAIFSLVDQALLQQLPVKNPERLVLLDWNGAFIGAGWGTSNLLPHPMYRELVRENQVFEGMFARHPAQVHLTVGNTPELVNAEIVTGSYFPVLGVRPALGRLIVESDDQKPGAHPVVVVSFDYWKNSLGAALDVIGRKVRVNNNPMTVIGVAQEGFRGIDRGDVPALWVPAMMAPQAAEFNWLDNRRGRWLHVFGRLKAGMTVEQARAGLQPWFKAMLEEDTRREDFPKITPEQRRRFLASSLEALPAAQGRSDLRARLEKPLVILLAATGLVLLLACLNVANLCLARAFSRRREIALRLALGASSGRIMRELMIQNTMLAVGGALLGVLLAPLVAQALISFLPETAGYSSEVNSRVFLFALAVALVTGFIFGLAPAMQASRADPGSTLKQESSTVMGGLGVRKLLVIGQISLALVLLIGSGLFVRTLANLRAKGPGFSTTNLLMFRLEPGKAGYNAEKSKRMTFALLETLRARPEVESASLAVGDMLTGGSWGSGLTIESGQRIVTNTIVCFNAISPGYFATLGAPLLAGRDFDERDRNESSEIRFRSAIVNESFARRYFGDRSPIGARIGMGTRLDTRADIEIVGVVKTFSRRGLRETDDQAYFPFLESPFNSAMFHVRTRMDPEAASASIRSAIRQIDASVPVSNMTTLDAHIDRRTLLNERLLANLASAFAALAVLLAIVGLYGVLTFVVSRRTREIGIRLALGASRGAAVGLILRDTIIMVAAGLAIALPSIWALGRLIENQLFGVRPTDAATIGAACVLVALAALTASALPARRATSVTPMEALRYE